MGRAETARVKGGGIAIEGGFNPIGGNLRKHEAVYGPDLTIHKPLKRTFLSGRKPRRPGAQPNGDLQMASPEWEGLESLSRDIGDARERLQAAKARRKSDTARVLEQEIAGMEKRQGELLAVIASSVVGEREEATAASPADSTDDPPSLVAPDVNKSVDTEPSAQRDREETAVWKQLTPADVEQARQELTRQRAEMLARHAEELKSLDAENAEVAALEQAIQVFMRKFGGAEVVPLEPNQSRA